ncbi:YfiR family protein [Nitrosomonas marina]|uniref:YfiR family protein n=1 Tax=Nitrosomonas marina TaxID=917 RepID=UPI000B8900AA
MSSILSSIREQTILTIADTSHAARTGIMTNLQLVDNKIKFEINLEAACRVGLNISARLLQLATQAHQ